MTMQSVRFWHIAPNGGNVLIKLNAGQTLHHYWAIPTDEGWTSESHFWSFNGEDVIDQWQYDGRDCDGRLTRGGESWFKAKNAKAGYGETDGTVFPAWEQSGSWQRDESAEAMGY